MERTGRATSPEGMGALLQSKSTKGMNTPSQDPPTPPTNNQGDPPQAPPTPPTPQAPPPAANVVKEGTKTEREATLERDLRAREQRLSELEDENRRLKVPPTPTTKDKEKHSWLAGGTFFDNDDE
jgi:hypothetical protein